MIRLLFFLIIISSICKGQDLYDFNHSLKFADYLAQSKQYDLAAKEYERLHFVNPVNDTLKLKLLNAYRLSGNIKYGIQLTEKLYSNLSTIPRDQALEYNKMLMLNKDFEKARNFTSTNQFISSDEKNLYHATADALTMNWKNALQQLENVDSSNIAAVKEYKQILNQALQMKHKSPGVAAGLSAVLPGSGKFYTGEWKDGIVSFIFVGACAWQAYRGFNKKGTESAHGWIFSTIGFGYYLGNIYGSYKSAKNFNKRLVKVKQEQIENLFYNNF